MTAEIMKRLKKKTMHTGPSSSLGAEAIESLLIFFEEHCQQVLLFPSL